MVITFTYMYIVIFLLGKLASKQTSPMDPTSIWDKPCTPKQPFGNEWKYAETLIFLLVSK